MPCCGSPESMVRRASISSTRARSLASASSGRMRRASRSGSTPPAPIRLNLLRACTINASMRSRGFLSGIQLVQSAVHQGQGSIELTGILGGVRGAHQQAGDASPATDSGSSTWSHSSRARSYNLSAS